MVDIRRRRAWSTSRIVNAHDLFWLRLMEKFVEHQEPIGPKTHKKQQHTPCAIARPALPYCAHHTHKSAFPGTLSIFQRALSRTLGLFLWGDFGLRGLLLDG